MNLCLPEPDGQRLPRSPLELVVCQIRFDHRAQIEESTVALAVHEQLGGAGGPYPQLEPIEGQQLVVSGGLGVEPQTEQRSSRGWRIASENGEWMVTLMSDHVGLETTGFTTWEEDFLPRLRDVVEAITNHLQPVIEQRLGLRFVDRIEELELDSIVAWSDYIAPEFLGPIVHPELGPAVSGMGQQVVLRVDEQLRAAIRSGPITDRDDGRVDYLLDYDIFRQGGRQFSADEVIATAAKLNTCAHQLFQVSITEKLLDFLQTP
jgi:uncharacterized protein (TIGR04255 family)